MHETIYHIKIKKEYAEAALEQLNQDFAIEILEENAVPDWQKNETIQRLQRMKNQPETTISHTDFFNALENEG
jgi:hypothetical protein